MKCPEISLLLGLSLVQILFSQAVPLSKNIVLHSNKNGTIQKSFHSKTISGLVLSMNNGNYGLNNISQSVRVDDESSLEPRIKGFLKMKRRSRSKKKNKNKSSKGKKNKKKRQKKNKKNKRKKGKKNKKKRQKKNKKNKCSRGKKNKKKCSKKNDKKFAGVENNVQNTTNDYDHNQRATNVDSNIENHDVGIRDHVANSAMQNLFLPSGGIPNSIPSLNKPDYIKDENYANDEEGNLYQEKDGIPDSLSSPDESANMGKINNADDQEGNSYQEE